MRALPLLLFGALAALALAAVAAVPDTPPVRTSAQARADLRTALAESRVAEARSAQLERAAESARDAAERTAREAAALAGRIQQAEAAIAVAEARLTLANRERAALREQLGREQQPLVHLTAALQQFSRRPLALAMLQPGSVQDTVYLRAMLDSAVPQIRDRTSGVRARLAQSRHLREEALAATEQLRAGQTRLAERRTELAALETRQRLAARAAGGTADREAE